MEPENVRNIKKKITI